MRERRKEVTLWGRPIKASFVQPTDHFTHYSPSFFANPFRYVHHPIYVEWLVGWYMTGRPSGNKDHLCGPFRAHITRDSLNRPSMRRVIVKKGTGRKKL